jgi:hypothetical protein
VMDFDAAQFDAHLSKEIEAKAKVAGIKTS